MENFFLNGELVENALLSCVLFHNIKKTHCQHFFTDPQ